MPFTPFHFGPGLLIKGLMPKRFSLTTFVAAQVAIDCETLYYMVSHQYPLHRGMHTFVGATSVGIATAGLALGLRKAFPRQVEELPLPLRAEAGKTSILLGGVIGGASHPFLDGIMHPDIHPFLPWTEANPLLDIIGLDALHVACVLAAAIGVVSYAQFSRQARIGGITSR